MYAQPEPDTLLSPNENMFSRTLLITLILVRVGIQPTSRNTTPLLCIHASLILNQITRLDTIILQELLSILHRS